MGIPHPSSRDGISAATGAGQSKIPHGTPVSITIPLKPHEAQERVGDACKLRMEYLYMKTKSLHCQQELIDKVKWIDDKISDVDVHIL